MTITSLIHLKNLEAKIRLELQKYDLDQVLASARNLYGKEEPFVIAGIALFGIRFSYPPILKPEKIYHISQPNYLVHLVKSYLIADPISFSSEGMKPYKNSTLIPALLRLSGNQFSFAKNFWGQYIRPLILLIDVPQKLKLPKGISTFDIQNEFEKLNQFSIEDFIQVGVVAYSASQTRLGFTANYFKENPSFEKNLKLPKGDIFNLIIDHLAADQYQLREKYEEYKQDNRLYAMYDFNPLFIFPIVRPWRKIIHTTSDEDRFIVPLPDLILYRLSSGIYEELVYNFKEKFTRYFGFVFQEYVGQILENFYKDIELISEENIQSKYKGKVPDLIIIEGETAILIECKAIGFSRKALATADEQAIDFSVSPIKKALIQLHEFRNACKEKEQGLEKLHSISRFKLLVITYETFYLINSTPFKEVINSEISSELSAKSIEISDWRVLSIDEFEPIQPHIKTGIHFNSILEMMNSMPYSEVIDKLHKQTGKTFRDSFLWEKQEELFEKLGVIF